MGTLNTISGVQPATLADDISTEAVRLAQMADALQNSLSRYRPSPLIDFSATIKAKRKELGMTGEEVAELSGISLTAYQRIEQDKSSPQLKTILAICDTLGLKLCVI